MKKTDRHVIKEVLPGSIAEELEVEAGDVLLAVNDEPVEDVFDYRFLIQDSWLTLLIEKADGEQWELEIEKDEEEDLGIIFENDLMSEYRSCSNQCIFCFIDQMPPGMRETLYFKDDDSRLSFLQGNYITLTNMSEKDIDRIIRFHLAPINISIHTTNPELRCKMLHNRFAGEKLAYLKRLYDHQIEMNGQIVLCRGINDGSELERTIRDLMEYLPFLRSVSVVPAGLTKYRDGLYPLELHQKEDACRVIDLVESFQEECYRTYGLHFIHASDEFYLLAERPLPEEERYDGYLQLENGVGMMRLLQEEFLEAVREETEKETYEQQRNTLKRTLRIATGALACPLLETLAETAMKAWPGLEIRVTPIRNRFFGETITVSGLVTGQDLVAQVLEAENKEIVRSQGLLVPCNMLRYGERVFLDDMTTDDVERETGLPLIPVGAEGKDLLGALLQEDYVPAPGQDREVYIKAYPER